jgi:hypothetical protein
MKEERPPRFYFALPRLLAMLRHGDSSRAEMNGAEAWAGSIAIFVISYLFFARLVLDYFAGWLAIATAVVLPFLVLLFWLAELHLNALILEALRRCGLFRSLPQRRGQAVLVCTATTAMALQLMQQRSLAGEIASIWLTAVALNLAAAIILAVRNGNAARS